MMSIPATKGFELGSGFSGTKMNGSQHNDAFYADNCTTEVSKRPMLKTSTNNSGGTLGGISTGSNIVTFFQK
jgi:chorismate synthase